jgi:FkbM family methyltransferase
MSDNPPVPLLQTLLGFSCSIKVVDIGANPIDGTPPYAPLLAAGHTSVVGFEPNREALAVLNARKGANETYLPLVVADGRPRKLHYCASPGMTSLLEPNRAVLSLFRGFSEWGAVIRTEEVDTVRLDDVAETAGLDLLKIDIQGAELMVLENAVARLAGTLVVHTEVEFLPMYVGQPLFSDVDQFLRRQGFVLHRFNPLVSRVVGPLAADSDPYEGLNQLLWADAVYVRDFQRLDFLSPEQLLRYAEIMHACYGSYDLALHALADHDRRLGTRYCEPYRSILLRARQAMRARTAASGASSPITSPTS